MRTLCLCLQRDAEPSVAENFLTFSPRVHYRAPGLVFLDVTSTAQMFGGEQSMLEEALYVSREFFPDAVGAISDTPWGAQALSVEKPNTISLPTREWGDLSDASLSRLHQLEGLIAWRSPREVGEIVDFFHMLGINRLGEIRNFQVDSFRERWQQTGTLIWKRLHNLDKQVICPLLPSEALQDSVYLDFPVSLMPFLLHCVEKSMQRLLARLQGRGEFARKMILHLFCEYSGTVHQIELQPTSATRNLELFMKLIEQKLAELNLDNPIKQIEIEVVPSPETSKPRPHLEPPVFHQTVVTTGFLNLKDEAVSEESWLVTPAFEDFESIEDAVAVEGQSFQIKPAYNTALAQSPRPSRLLKRPRALEDQEFHRYQLLSSHPVERLEDSGWENSRGRDYYFALATNGEFVWLFHDRIENRYYLHGYFD